MPDRAVQPQVVDVWSIGVITYIMLCGEPPFKGPDDDAVFAKVKAGCYDYRRAVWRSVSRLVWSNSDLGRIFVELSRN